MGQGILLVMLLQCSGEPIVHKVEGKKRKSTPPPPSILFFPVLTSVSFSFFFFFFHLSEEQDKRYGVALCNGAHTCKTASQGPSLSPCSLHGSF